MNVRSQRRSGSYDNAPMYQAYGHADVLPIAMMDCGRRPSRSCSSGTRTTNQSPSAKDGYQAFGTTPKRQPTIVDGWRRRSLDANDDNSASNVASRFGLDTSTRLQAIDGVRARLRERVKRSAQFTSCAACYETVVLRARAV
jgi:hypothetical protein